MMKWLIRILGILVVGAAGLAGAVFIGGPDLVYPRVPGQSFGPSSIEFTDTDPGPGIGGTILLGRAQDERGVETRAEAFSECGFAGADGPFDRDVAELQGVPMISSRRDAYDARDATQSRGEPFPFMERAADAVHCEVSVEAEDFSHQLGAEAVHHGQHDD